MHFELTDCRWCSPAVKCYINLNFGSFKRASMRCPNCGSENPTGKRFCEDCGTPLADRCPRCGAETTAGKRFCGECGAPLDTVSSVERPSSFAGLAGER